MAEIQRYYFEDGNAARNIAEVLPDREERKRRAREEQKRRQRQAERARRAQLRKNRVYTIYLSVATACACAFLGVYVHVQNDISTSMNNIASLESQISDLKADNKATEARIDSDANLYVVKYAAVAGLGMVYADSDQIVYYDMEDADYMSQYEDIP